MSEYIGAEELEQALASATPPVVIDVRGDEEYAAGHIPGARHIPADEVPSHLDEIPSDRLIVPYWNMRHRGSSRSERVAALLRESGYDARALEGGFPGWQEAGKPVEAGA